jgi:hypothetical protein
VTEPGGEKRGCMIRKHACAIGRRQLARLALPTKFTFCKGKANKNDENWQQKNARHIFHEWSLDVYS